MYLKTVSITFQHPSSETIANLEAMWLQERIQLLLNNRYQVISDGCGVILQAKFNKDLLTDGVEITDGAPPQSS